MHKLPAPRPVLTCPAAPAVVRAKRTIACVEGYRSRWFQGLLVALTLVCVVGVLGSAARGQQPVAGGRLDPTFNASTDGRVATLAVQSDGKIVLGGNFTQVNGTPHGYLARLQPGGTLDADFPADADGPVLALAVQPDGRVLVGGAFSRVGTVACAGIARLQADGRVDAGFAASTDGAVESMALQADGKVLVGGVFSLVNGEARSNVARLNADGSLDEGFTARITPAVGLYDSAEVLSIAAQPDGKILLGGPFVEVNGAPRQGLARLHPDGSLDLGFTASAPGGLLRLALQPDGKILLGGYFYSVNGVEHPSLARLGASGRLDAGFNAVAGDDVTSFAFQADGRIVIGGGFDQINDARRSNLARLEADGRVDPDFTASANLQGRYGEVYDLAMQPDGNLLVAGFFSQVNGETHRNVARLLADASLAPALPSLGLSINAAGLSRASGFGATVIFTRTGGDPSTVLKLNYTLGGSLAAGTDYTVPLTKKIKAGRAGASVLLLPLAGGGDGKVKLKLLPGEGYIVAPGTTVKVRIFP